MKKRSGIVVIGLILLLIAVGLVPLQNAFLQSDMNGNGFSITNLHNASAQTLTLGGVTITTWPGGGGPSGDAPLPDTTTIVSNANLGTWSVGSIAASQIGSGTIATARLGSGTANAGAALLGNQTWGAMTNLTTGDSSLKISGGVIDSATILQSLASLANASGFLQNNGSGGLSWGSGGSSSYYHPLEFFTNSASQIALALGLELTNLVTTATGGSYPFTVNNSSGNPVFQVDINGNINGGFTPSSTLYIGGETVLGNLLVDGNLEVLGTQSANQGYFGPPSGAAAAPAFRAMVTADLPSTINAIFGGYATLTNSSIWNPTNNVVQSSNMLFLSSITNIQGSFGVDTNGYLTAATISLGGVARTTWPSGGGSTFNNNQFFSGGTGPVTNLQTNQTFAALTLTQGITYGAGGTNAYPANGRTNMWGGGMLTNILNGATNIFYGGVSSKGYAIFLYPTGNVTTDTANAQAAFNFPDSVVIYMARGLYYWNQITFPAQADSPNRTLEVHGANAFPTGQDQATLGLVQVDGTGYTIISNNLTGGLWGQALIMPATTTGFNYTQVNMDKLIFLTPTNPSYGILNLSNTVGHNINIEVLNASEYVVTSPYPIIPTNTNAVAIYCAAQPNDGELDGCLISGYYWGIVAGDGTYLHNCFFFCCSNSILTGLAGQLGVVHNLYFDRLYEIECVNGITSGSNSPVNIHGSDWIVDYDASDPAHWGVPRHDLNDNKNNFYTPPYGIAYNQGGYNTNYAPTNFGGSNFLFSSYPNPLQPQLTFGAPFLNLLCSNITAYGTFSQANAGSSWTSGSQTQGIGSQGITNNQNMFIYGGQNSGNYVDISSYYTEGAVYNDVYTWAVRPNGSAANGLQFLYQQSLGLNSGLDHGGLVINNLPIVISAGNNLGGAYWAWNIPLSGGTGHRRPKGSSQPSPATSSQKAIFFPSGLQRMPLHNGIQRDSGEQHVASDTRRSGQMPN